MKLYRGTIAYDDDTNWKRGDGRNPEKRHKWYKKYQKTEKYKTYHREYMRKKRKADREAKP